MIALLSKNNCSPKFFLRKFFQIFWPEFFTEIIFARFAYFFIHCSQNSVYKFSGRISAESFSKFNRFVDRHLWRNLFAVSKKKFCKAQTQNISVHRSNLLQRPLGS